MSAPASSSMRRSRHIKSSITSGTSGPRALRRFSVTTPAGHILINSTTKRTSRDSTPRSRSSASSSPTSRSSSAATPTAITWKATRWSRKCTGAQVMAMAEDVPALERMMPGGKPHPIDRVLHDGDTVTLGGTTLVAHLTPGHTKGCTTWTMKVHGRRPHLRRRHHRQRRA